MFESSRRAGDPLSVSDADGPDRAESLLAACFALEEEDRAPAIEAACASHPELADVLRARLAALEEMGIGIARDIGLPEQLGEFRLIERLGGGGMGVVYLAHQTSLKRDVALKLIRPEHLYFPGAHARFHREAEAMARLSHPGIVPIHAVGEHQGIPYFAMEFVRGCTLAAALKVLEARAPESLRGSDLFGIVARAAGSDDPLPEGTSYSGSWIEACLRIARQVAEALEHAHLHGLVHRDVKPSNIALTPDGRAMLLDFGLTRGREQGDLTRTGSRLGTLLYMSPEQLSGSRAVDPRSDVYSLGVTLYEMLALQLPYRGESFLEIERSIHDGRPDPLRPRNRKVEPDLETSVLCALERDPARRYPSAAGFARDLGHLLARETIEARRPGVFLRARRWMQRHPAGATAAVLGPLLVLGAAGVLLFQEKRHSRELGRANEGLAAASKQALDQADQAEVARELAERRAEDVLSLSAGKNLQDLVERADLLWPAEPEEIPLLETWLSDARVLVEGRAADAAGGVRARPGLADHERKLAELEAHADPGDDEHGWWRAQLANLVADLRAFSDPLTGLDSAGTNPEHGWGVRKRLEFAHTIADASEGSFDARARWERAIASIADRSQCPRYDGLVIAPQLGLLPIGIDPASGLWEFAHLATGDPPERAEDGTLVLKENTGLVFVLIPYGTFWMGAQKTDPTQPNYDPEATPDESPVHEVTLDAYFLSKYEMTQGQWKRFAGNNPSLYGQGSQYGGKWTTPLHPVEQVSWKSAERILARLRLSFPTEAQWEYAARAGTSTPWWTGSAKETLAGAANLHDTFSKSHGGAQNQSYEEWLDDGYTAHAPVGSYRANSFGLHDVSGNVHELCREGFAGYEVPVRPGEGEREFISPSRMIRGGSYHSGAGHARSAWRADVTPKYSDFNIGLRPAQAIAP